VYNAVPSRDRAVTETTVVSVALFRSHLVAKKIEAINIVVSVKEKTVTSLRTLENG
jgi:hypothetical protein